MKIQIREGVFESNSSSTHTLCICTEEQFSAWRRGEVLYDRWNDCFVKPTEMTEEDKENAKEYYVNSMDKYWKEWEELTEQERHEWYEKYAEENGFQREGCDTYDDYMYNSYLDSYSESYTTEHGDQIHVFGHYGYDS